MENSRDIPTVEASKTVKYVLEIKTAIPPIIHLVALLKVVTKEVCISVCT